MKTLLTVVVTLTSLTAIAQPGERKSVVIGSMTTKPNALLIVNPQNSDQGVLLPQLSTGQRLSVNPSSPAENGLIVFDSNLRSYFFWSEGGWVRLHADNNRKDRFYSIDPVNFQELKPNFNIRHNKLAVFEPDNSFVTASRNGLGEGIIAPLNLPHRAVMQALTVYYMDNDGGNLKLYLIRKSLSGSNQTIMSWESSGTSPAVRNESFQDFADNAIVDLENYTYRVVVVFDINEQDIIDEPSQASQRMYGIRIKYQE